MPRDSRWSPEDKISIVPESLTTRIPMSEMCGKDNFTPYPFYQWRKKFIEGGRRRQLHISTDISNEVGILFSKD